MAKAYLVGGVPRCGKTNIALKVVGQQPMFATSTDSVRYLLRGQYAYEHAPELFDASEKFSETHGTALCLSGRAGEIIDAQNKESEVVWKSVKRVIEGYIAEDLDILVEGVAILPHLVAQLDCEYSAIFVGNTSPKHGKYMLSHARSGSYDWMSGRSDESIIAFANFTNEFSAFFSAEAKKYGMDFLDYADEDFDKYVADASFRLLGASVDA